jgi:hypothetical protein
VIHVDDQQHDSRQGDDHRPDDTTDRATAKEPARDERTGRSAAAERIRHQSRWVELQVEQAMARGEFDDLPGAGKPIEGLGTDHDPDWWLKKLIEREQVTGVLPPALALRKEDAELDAVLDRLPAEREVRREVEDFNARIRKALYTPPPNNLPAPPVVTRQRDVEAEVVAWRGRRTARIEAQREVLRETAERERADREARGRTRRALVSTRSLRSLLNRRR